MVSEMNKYVANNQPVGPEKFKCAHRTQKTFNVVASGTSERDVVGTAVLFLADPSQQQQRGRQASEHTDREHRTNMEDLEDSETRGNNNIFVTKLCTFENKYFRHNMAETAAATLNFSAWNTQVRRPSAGRL